MIDLKRHIRDVPDFPKPGIVFKDITPLLADADAFRAAIDALVAPYRGRVDLVLGIESRGFIVGVGGGVRARHRHRRGAQARQAAVAARTARSYELEYGTDALEIHHDAVGNGHRVLLVDDLLATGGTARAAIELVERCGGQVVGVRLPDRARVPRAAGHGWRGHEVHALIAY